MKQKNGAYAKEDDGQMWGQRRRRMYGKSGFQGEEKIGYKRRRCIYRMKEKCIYTAFSLPT
jgi:hypothetical protein